MVAMAQKSKPPFSSKELIEYQSKDDQKLLDFGKTKYFLGVITRLHEASDLKHLDLYGFADLDGKPMTDTLCHQIIERIFGKISESSLKFSSPKILNVHSGKACEVQIIDPDKDAKVPQRHLFVGSLNTKSLALVLPLSKEENSFAAIESLKKFWSSLR